MAPIELSHLQALESELQEVRILRAELREEYAFAFDHLDGEQNIGRLFSVTLASLICVSPFVA